MPDEPRRPRGRPPLKDGEPSTSLSLRLPQSDYDRADAIARKHGTTVAEIFRAAFRVATKQQGTIDPAD